MLQMKLPALTTLWQRRLKRENIFLLFKQLLSTTSNRHLSQIQQASKLRQLVKLLL